MSYIYSEILRERTINHFRQKYGLIISHEKADVYLASFSNLFRSFAKQLQKDEALTDGGEC